MDICLHEHTQIELLGRRLFALILLVRETSERDEVLDLSIIERYGAKVLVGLPSISVRKLYIINISDIDREYLVWVD